MPDVSNIPIIDAHLHVWGSPFPNRPFNWTPDPFPIDDLLQILDTNGVTSCVGITPIMYDWDNGYGVAAAEKYPSRFKVFGRFDPLAPNVTERLGKWMSQSGSAGVRLTFYGDGLKHLDKPELLEPFWNAAEDLRVRVAIFAPDALWKIVDVMEEHPKLKLVVDHLGLGVYPGCEDPFLNFNALFRFKPFPQVLVKLSGAVEVSRDDHPFKDAQEIVAAAKDAFGCSRLMWGSNYPVSLSKCSYGETLNFVGDCNFSKEERELVLGGTCQRMLSEDGNFS